MSNRFPANGRATPERLRIALLAGPMEPVPPVAYGGTERVVAALAESRRRGHEVTVFASGDSTVDAAVEPIIDRALWRIGYRGDVSAYLLKAVERCRRVADRFDLIHSHVEAFGFPLARQVGVPVISTLHGRLDVAGMPALLEEYGDIPLVAISESQRRWAPDACWAGVVHNGLPLDAMPFGEVPGNYLLVVGRVSPEKGIAEGIELARRTQLPLKVAAKVHDPAEQQMYQQLVAPAIADGTLEFLGELQPSERDPLYAGARATLMLGAWPEPFGLVAIESLATGTPVIARRAGALPEIVRHGVDGYLVDDIAEAEHALTLLDRLDRAEIRRGAIARFSARRMADDYERIYHRLLMGFVSEPALSAPARVGQAVGEGRRVEAATEARIA